jgi:hypothetical protein
MAVRVHNEADYDDFRRREGITTIPFYERDSHGQRRHSIYIGQGLASQVHAGDIVELVVNARTTRRGRNLRLGPIRVVQPAPQPS